MPIYWRLTRRLLIKTIVIILELLIVYFEEHVVDIIEYKEATSSESLASYVAYTFINNRLLVGSKMGNPFWTHRDNSNENVQNSVQ